MNRPLQSKALEANLAQTRAEEIPLPAEHEAFIALSKSHFGIHQKTREFFLEYHHPFSNRQFAIERWREILLRDFWFYSALPECEKAFSTLLEIGRKFADEPLDAHLQETIVETLLEFIGNQSEEQTIRKPLILQALEILEQWMTKREAACIRVSRHFKAHLPKTAALTELSPKALALTKTAMEKSIRFWESTTDVEIWFEKHTALFGGEWTPIAAALGKPYFAELHRALAQAADWPQIGQIPSFDEIAAHFRQAAERFEAPLEKIYFLVHLLDLPGMSRLKDNLLWDINRLLRNIHKDVSGERMIAFAGNLMDLFAGLRSQLPGEVLDCLLTLGKELIDTEDRAITDFYVRRLIDFGFTGPGEIRITPEWQIEVDPNHVKHIRIWLELFEYDPQAMKDLLPALVVNLRLGGIFISDTDLFQKDVTKLLNAEIEPVYKIVKDLARLFPVYFTEIGAEGELRDVTTAIDELSRRRDRLIHFLRKQTHTESNNTHVELTRRILRFWFDGDIEPLRKLVPPDVLESIDLKGDLFVPVHEIVQGMCRQAACTPEELLEMPEDRIETLLAEASASSGTDKERVRLLLRSYALLREKYSFEARDVIPFLRKSRIVTESEIESLNGALSKGDEVTALREIYRLMDRLKSIILSPEPSEGWENIYYKRHVAAGIPSMYGEYREPKFEALGMTFRLEKAASQLMQRIVQDINLDYITIKTLRRVSEALGLFREGLVMDGIRDEGFDANLKMLESSFSSASLSLDQYTNILEFLEQSVKGIIERYYLHLYDPPLRAIVPHLLSGAYPIPEAELKEVLHKTSESFLREVISSAFLIQLLDNFLSETVRAIRSMGDHLPREFIREVMTYDPDLIISPLCKRTPWMDNPIFLGAKAFFLKELHAADFPVPPGFVLTTEVFRHRNAIVRHPRINEEIEGFIRLHLTMLEQAAGRKFGDPADPLLLSVRAGTAISMPGAMATFLNVGINDAIAERWGRISGRERTAWDCYRRFLQSWGISRGINRDLFDEVTRQFESRYGAAIGPAFPAEGMKAIAREYMNILEAHSVRVESDPFRQLRRAILEVMDSWDSERARIYREHLQIADEWGTAVIVQKMVLGNLSDRSGTGVIFTHDPTEMTGELRITGDFGVGGQGEDIVSGCIHTLPITEAQRQKYQYDSELSLETAFPEIYRRLLEITEQLVKRLGLGPQEIEFTFESERPEDLYILQTRRQDVRKRSKRSVFGVPRERMELVGRGIGVGGGALSGVLAFDMADLKAFAAKYPNEPRILVRPDTVPDDIGMVFNCEGLITGKGGATSHAAVTAARLGKVCVVGCKGLQINESAKVCTINGTVFKAGDPVSIEGHLGDVYKGRYPIEIMEIG